MGLPTRPDPVRAGPEQVLLGSRTELHDHQSAGRVRDENIQQPVALACDEALAVLCQVEEAAPASGLDGQLSRLQGAASETVMPLEHGAELPAVRLCQTIT
jgi:hypothetical protein